MALLFAGLPLLLLVQAPGASVAGTIRDEDTGAPIPGAIVALTDLRRQTSSDGFGRWVFLEVPAGPQRLQVRAIGRAPRMVSALVPNAGRLTIDLSLRAEAVRLPGLEVHGPVAVPGLDRDNTADRWISLAAVRSHPLLAEPDVFQALAGGEIALRPESPSGVHIHGGAADQTAYLLDGIPVFNPYHAGGMFSAWNPDALDAVHLATTLTAGGPHSLSGAVAGVTRTPGQRLSAQGSLTTTQSRMTLDGPLGGGASFLAAIRFGYHGLIAPSRETSYLAGGSGDWMVKLEAPVLRGRLRLLGVASQDELSADAGSGGEGPNPPRNVFEWESRSVGAEWRRQLGNLTLGVTAWDARAEAEAEWLGEAGSQRLGSARGDRGLWWALERRTGPQVSLIGLRLERSATEYRVDSLGSPAAPGGRSGHTSVITGVIAHSFGLGAGFGARVGGDLAAGAGAIRGGPQAELSWRRSDQLRLAASYARTHQFAQSLRNPESVAGNIFLPDLYLGVGSEGVPVARSDLAVLRADYRPTTGVRIGMQAYARRFQGLLLAAPRTAEPYSTGAFETGRGTAGGLSVEAAISRAHFGVMAGYGLERLRIVPSGAVYVPGHGATHRVEGGIIVFPVGGASIRLGAVAALGRRATGVVGDFEWEACNLLDRGCEFRGSPRADSALGAVALPAYFRVDLGVRQRVQFRIAGREASVALFGTITNLLGRRNVLTYSEDPALGVRSPVEMRPRAPLVVGLDWRF